MVKWSVVKWDNAGGMQLLATAPIAAGEEILREKPLVAVAGSDLELGSPAWDLTHRLIADTRLRDASRAGVTPSQFDGKSRGVLAYRALLKHLLAQQLVPQVA